MELTREEQGILTGANGPAARKAIEILVALGTIYGADRLVAVRSVQIAGVSYDNLGEAGLEFLTEMASKGARTKILATLNPAGMDVENWEALGIDPEFARNQTRVIEAYTSMGIVPTCSCTPYLFGNLPHYGEHIAWAESSAVAYANSVLGARTNREGGPSALAAAITGRTPNYGLHLSENRRPTLTVRVVAKLSGTRDFGALGISLGRLIEARKTKAIPLLRGVAHATMEELKSFCASVATYGGLALFHMEGITPESVIYPTPDDTLAITRDNLEEAVRKSEVVEADEVDFVTLGCPHLSLEEIAHVASQLKGKKVTKTFWITTARPTKDIADRMGYTADIEAAGAVVAADTCCVVAPIKDQFKVMATDSAKACYYAASKHGFKPRLLNFEDVIQEALK
jgi:phosphomecalonate degydratase large subunit